jgi:hypothetical protein
MKIRSIIKSILSAGLPAGLLIILFSCVEQKNTQTDELVGAWKRFNLKPVPTLKLKILNLCMSLTLAAL